MDMNDVLDWLSWGVLALCFLALVLVGIMAIVVAVANVVHFYRCGGRPCGNPLPIEELLKRIPDVPYHEELAAGGGEEERDSRESCVICITPYEAGEACAVLPPCTHMFHKACVAKWLYRKSTCPLCRAAVAPLLPYPPLPVQQQVNAADNMV